MVEYKFIYCRSVARLLKRKVSDERESGESGSGGFENLVEENLMMGDLENLMEGDLMKENLSHSTYSLIERHIYLYFIIEYNLINNHIKSRLLDEL